MNNLDNNCLTFQRVWFNSKVLGKDVENIIVLPNKYDVCRKYPVLYLLVGADNPLDSWVELTNLCLYAAEFDMIIATPNNGWKNRQSWYVDSHIMENSAYETYVTGEFIEYIDSNYSTINDENGRAISGISMGGMAQLRLQSSIQVYIALSHHLWVLWILENGK